MYLQVRWVCCPLTPMNNTQQTMAIGMSMMGVCNRRVTFWKFSIVLPLILYLLCRVEWISFLNYSFLYVQISITMYNQLHQFAKKLWEKKLFSPKLFFTKKKFGICATNGIYLIKRVQVFTRVLYNSLFSFFLNFAEKERERAFT